MFTEHHVSATAQSAQMAHISGAEGDCGPEGYTNFGYYVFLYTVRLLIPRFSPYQPSLPRFSSCWRQRNQSAQLVRMTFFNESKHVLSQEFFFYSNIWNLFLMTLIHLVELFRNHLFYFIIFSSVPWRWGCQSTDQWISEEFVYYSKQKPCSWPTLPKETVT